MPTFAELKQQKSKIKLKVRQGDAVVIIAGKDKGQQGIVAKVMPKDQKVIVLQENPSDPNEPIPLNAAVKHKKAKTTAERSARFKMPVPLHISNVMLIDPKLQVGSRVGRRVENGKIVRFAKKSGETLNDQPNIVRES